MMPGAGSNQVFHGTQQVNSAGITTLHPNQIQPVVNPSVTMPISHHGLQPSVKVGGFMAHSAPSGFGLKT